MATSTVSKGTGSENVAVEFTEVGYTIGTTSSSSGSFVITKPGWMPVGIVGWKSGYAQCSLNAIEPTSMTEGSMTVYWMMRSYSSAQQTTRSIGVYSLWVR